MATMDTNDARRFGLVMARLDANLDDAERLVTLNRADAMLKAAGLTWAKLAALVPAPAAQPINPFLSAAASRSEKSKPARGFGNGAFDADVAVDRDIRDIFKAHNERRFEAGHNGDTGPAGARSRPQRVFQQGRQIPARISGRVTVVDRGEWRGGIKLVVTVEEVGTVYGPLTVFNSDLVAAIEAESDLYINGRVQQGDDRFPPVLTGAAMQAG